MGKSASAPPAPDYVGAAKETASGNLDAARAILRLIVSVNTRPMVRLNTKFRVKISLAIPCGRLPNP